MLQSSNEQIIALEMEARQIKYSIQAQAYKSKQRLAEIIAELKNIQIDGNPPESFNLREAIDNVTAINSRMNQIKTWN